MLLFFIVCDLGLTSRFAENSVDNAYRTVNGQQRDVHNDNPAEKVYRCASLSQSLHLFLADILQLVGDPSNPQSVFGGYPYCFSVWEPSNFVDTTFQPGDWFVQAPNSTMNDAWCNANAVKPTVLLPPHTAPLDFKFGVGSDTNMYAGLHGSWNRSPPQVCVYLTIVDMGILTMFFRATKSSLFLAASRAQANGRQPTLLLRPRRRIKTCSRT